MRLSPSLVRLVLERAERCCEYCKLFDGDFGDPFEIDHVVPTCHGGESVAENLAYSCWPCNSYKGPNLTGIDPKTNRVVRLYHPRKDRWDEHFYWRGPELIGKSSKGRATASVLKINRPEAIFLRTRISS